MTILDQIYRKKKKSRKLRDISVDEVSLVDRAATGETFFIMKAADDDVLGQALREFCDVEDLEKEAPPIEALKQALGLLMKYKTDFPDTVLAAIQVLARAAGGKDIAADGADYGYPGSSHLSLPGFKKPVKKGDEKWSSFSLSQIGVQIPLRITKRWDAEAEELADPDEPIPEESGPPPKGVSKAARGQDNDDDGAEESKELWPSL